MKEKQTIVETRETPIHIWRPKSKVTVHNKKLNQDANRFIRGSYKKCRSLIKKFILMQSADLTFAFCKSNADLKFAFQKINTGLKPTFQKLNADLKVAFLKPNAGLTPAFLNPNAELKFASQVKNTTFKPAFMKII